MSGCVQQEPDAAVRCSSVQLKRAEPGFQHVGATVHVFKIGRSICVWVFVFIPSCSVSCMCGITRASHSSKEPMKSADGRTLYPHTREATRGY